MRIDETEGLIAGERDPLAGRWQRRGSANGRGELEKAGMADDGVEIDVALGGVGETLDQRGKVWMLRSLDEAKMPLGQRERRLARQCAVHRNSERRDRVGNQRPMA